MSPYVDLLVAIVSAPATAAVASSATIAAAESSVVTILALLVAVPALMSEAAKASAVLAVAATKMARVAAAKALLVRLLRSTLARGLRGRSGTTLLSTQSRGARATALRITEWLQRIFTGARLSTLLLAIGTRVGVAALLASKRVRESTEPRICCSTVVLRSTGRGSAVVTQSS